MKSKCPIVYAIIPAHEQSYWSYGAWEYENGIDYVRVHE